MWRGSCRAKTWDPLFKRGTVKPIFHGIVLTSWATVAAAAASAIVQNLNSHIRCICIGNTFITRCVICARESRVSRYIEVDRFSSSRQSLRDIATHVRAWLFPLLSPPPRSSLSLSCRDNENFRNYKQSLFSHFYTPFLPQCIPHYYYTYSSHLSISSIYHVDRLMIHNLHLITLKTRILGTPILWLMRVTVFRIFLLSKSHERLRCSLYGIDNDVSIIFQVLDYWIFRRKRCGGRLMP